MQRKTVELWVGVFVLLGLLALGVLAFKVSNLSGSSIGNGYTITAHFDNIGGLTLKAPVSMAGVRIGRVKEIRVDPDDYRAVVSMLIDGRFDSLPADTSAAILTAGLLGAQYVGLEPGGDDTYLVDGDQLYLTQSALVLEQLIGRMLFSKAAGETE